MLYGLEKPKQKDRKREERKEGIERKDRMKKENYQNPFSKNRTSSTVFEEWGCLHLHVFAVKGLSFEHQHDPEVLLAELFSGFSSCHYDG